MSQHARTWPALDVAGLPPADAPDAHDAVQGDLLEATLTDFDVEAIDESAPAGWRVFFRTRGGRDRAQQAIARQFPALGLTPVDVPDEDWAARSQASLKAVRVGNLIVAPPWDAPIVVAIRPSMGGTGHHATTRLCLAALQALEVKERTVIDVGTGSGVLAIAASLLGAVNVRGIDDDEDAIHAAWDNLALNPAAIVTLLVGDLRNTEFDPADIVFGNLTGGLLMASAAAMGTLAGKPHGKLILSGFQDHEEADVVSSFAGFVVERREQEDEWVCVTLKRT